MFKTFSTGRVWAIPALAAMLSAPSFGAIVFSIDCNDASGALMYHHHVDVSGVGGGPPGSDVGGTKKREIWQFGKVALPIDTVKFDEKSKVVLSTKTVGPSTYVEYQIKGLVKLRSEKNAVLALACKQFSTKALPPMAPPPPPGPVVPPTY